jgi:HECT-like Ubiquitin-conjugating enzyme (E2)-binding/MYND finger
MVAVVKRSQPASVVRSETQCQYCGESDVILRRCAQCKMVWYCSVVCQRNDWNRFGDRSPHREACRAWAELSKMVLSSSLSDAARGYHEANDEIEKIRQAQSRLPKKTPLRVPREQAPISEPVSSADTASWIISNAPKVSFHVEDTPNLRCYNIYVAIDLEQREESPATPGDWSVHCTTVGLDRTRLTIFNSNWPNMKLLQLLLPRLLATALTPPRVHSISARSALVRVSYTSAVDSIYTNEPCSYDFDFKPLAVDQANGLACRSCLQPLFSPADEQEPIIRRVSPLPSGRWNDMDDFLICYPGTAAVNFASTSTHGQPGCLWIDENILVCSSLDAATSLSVLPGVVGYGQSWAQGPHREGPMALTVSPSSESTLSQAQDPALRGAAQIWHDSVPGETLCCSRCCSVLGWSCKSMEQTYRLLRHRLVLPNLHVALVPKEKHQGFPCLAFIAREMVRYAECQAIFTFALILDSIDKGPINGSSSNETQSAGRIPCVWLRLLSWDTIAANGTTPSSSSETDLARNHSGESEWCQVAKVAFEEGLLSVDDVVPNVDVFPDSFFQRGVTDWCCPRTRSKGSDQTPDASALQQAPAGSQSLNRDSNTEAFGTVVHLHLETEEWIAARRALRHAGRWYSFEMVQATIMAQTGKEIYNIDNKQAGLAAIRLRD